MDGVATTSRSHVRDLALAPDGDRRIARAARQLPVLQAVRDRLERDRPLAGVRVAACLHVTAETAVLALALQAGGADVLLCGAGPLSTQDDTAAALVALHGIPVLALHGEDDDTRFAHLESACDHRPQLVLDSGAELAGLLHAARRELLGGIIAATEETPTGALRLRGLEREGKLAFPVVAVGEARTRRLFADRHGTGQAAVQAVAAATGQLVAGSVWLVAGYGACGRGVAARARGLGAHVVVAEIDPQAALEAVLDGFQVLPLDDAAQVADVIVTATGSRGVVGVRHVPLLKDGVVLANAGHLNVEIEAAALRATADEVLPGGPARPLVEELRLPGGRTAVLLAQGRPVALAGGDGLPPQVADVACAAQALAAEHAVRHAPALERRVAALPDAIDREIARVKLATMGIAIDQPTADQQRYLASWEEGA